MKQFTTPAIVLLLAGWSAAAADPQAPQELQLAPAQLQIESASDADPLTLDADSLTLHLLEPARQELHGLTTQPQQGEQSTTPGQAGPDPRSPKTITITRGAGKIPLVQSTIAGKVVELKSPIQVRLTGEQEIGPFLGVSTSAVPAVLREHLQLPKGVGLVVEHVDPGSPAESAGLKRFDILQKLNDQLLINSEQLAVLIRTMKPGDEVTLAYLRAGQPLTTTTKLAEKKVAAFRNLVLPNAAPVSVKLDDLKLHQNLLADNVEFDPRSNVTIFRDLAADKDGFASTFLNANGAASLVISDAEHTLTITTRDGKRHLTAIDTRTGKMIFDGPFETAEDRRSLPPSLASKLEAFSSWLPPRPQADDTPASTEPQAR